MRKDKEGYIILIKGTISKEDIIIVNICSKLRHVQTYKRHTMMSKTAINSNTAIIFSNLNISLSLINRSS